MLPYGLRVSHVTFIESFGGDDGLIGRVAGAARRLCAQGRERRRESKRGRREREREREGETVRVESFIVWKWQPYELSLS